jgi:hypothetical protein
MPIVNNNALIYLVVDIHFGCNFASSDEEHPFRVTFLEVVLANLVELIVLPE